MKSKRTAFNKFNSMEQEDPPKDAQAMISQEFQMPTEAPNAYEDVKEADWEIKREANNTEDS